MASKRNDPILHRVGKKLFNGKNLLAFSAWIEEERIIGNQSVFNGIVFIELSEGYNASTRMKMKIDATDLRAMAYAFKEAISTGQTKYKKYTDPKLANLEGGRKFISIVSAEKGQFFFNMTEGNNERKFVFERHDFASAADSLALMADEIEKMQYWLQRSASTQAMH